jgi:carbamoyltransferase
VQDACEVAMLALVKLATQKPNCRNVCLAGGVALNSKANGKIQASGMVDNILFSRPLRMTAWRLAPVCALPGQRRPAADEADAPRLSRPRIFRCGNRKGAADLQASRIQADDVAATTAELLANGKIIGWFQGRMEFGPRALGASLDPGRSARSGNEREGEQRGQIPRVVAPVRAFDAEGKWPENISNTPAIPRS